jgi:hypothetical protein
VDHAREGDVAGYRPLTAHSQQEAQDSLRTVQHPARFPHPGTGDLEAAHRDRRLSEGLAECDARGWDALPLAAKKLTRLFPLLWETRKAAERWTAKNPREAYLDIIRVWRVLNDYRPRGQTRWSKALVRADARLALAAVLGMPAEDIRVRESAG